MTSALAAIFTQGVNHWSTDTNQRTEWIESEPSAWHLLSGTMLVGLFAYTESNTERFFWKKLKKPSNKVHFEMLWIARNVFVHNNSIVKKSRFIKSDSVKRFEKYCSDLANSKIIDDKGQVFPIYLTLSRDKEIFFSKSAINIFRALFQHIYNVEENSLWDKKSKKIIIIQKHP
ncbi:MAG: hypothetical protein RI911_178 [Candidatus Parcubacteria bacterium]